MCSFDCYFISSVKMFSKHFSLLENVVTDMHINTLIKLKLNMLYIKLYEPRHDTTNIVRLRPALIQTNLRIRAV
jgi:hypothetical protein